MVAVVIFWAALMAIIFFLLGNIFKALASAFNALISSLGFILAVGGLALLGIIALYLIYGITDGIVTSGVGEVIGEIFLLIIELGILGAIFGGLGAAILELLVTIVGAILMFISGILEWAADLFERGYAKFLKVIINNLEKC